MVVVVIESGSRVVRSEMGVLSYTLRGFDDGALLVGAVAVVVVVLEVAEPPASGNCKAVESKRVGMVIENGEDGPALAAAA
jgi:hypothetical protein